MLPKCVLHSLHEKFQAATDLSLFQKYLRLLTLSVRGTQILRPKCDKLLDPWYTLSHLMFGNEIGKADVSHILYFFYEKSCSKQTGYIFKFFKDFFTRIWRYCVFIVFILSFFNSFSRDDGLPLCISLRHLSHKGFVLLLFVLL